MNPAVPVAWQQLRREPKRLLAAVAGITFTIVMMLVQLGFEEAVLLTAGLHIDALNGDIILASPQYQYMLTCNSFSARHFYQALGVAGVAGGDQLQMQLAPWKHPVTGQERAILVMGAEPRHGIFRQLDIDQQIEKLKDPEVVLFDVKSRHEFGPVAADFLAGKAISTEIAGRRVNVGGLFQIGTNFGVDGTVIASDLAFFRLLPTQFPGAISLGIIRVRPDADVEAVRHALDTALAPEVRAYTRQEFIEKEKNYWYTNTPIGFLFKFGAGLGLAVGLVVVYQILYTDVNDHLPEYATLKAIGFPNSYLFWLVAQESIILSVFGFLPGVAISMAVYKFAGDATHLPLSMTAARLAVTYALALAMCLLAAFLAMRPVRNADPASIL